jgi:transcriptional regulator
MVRYAVGLTEREKAILRLKKRGLSDYEIGRKLKTDVTNVTRSHRNALKKIAQARADLEFLEKLRER